MEKPKPRTWDRGLDYDMVLRRILELRGYARSLRKARMLRALNIALVQLANGLRISEAIECYERFIESNGVEREVVVRVRKSKEKYRLCIIPDVIDRTDVTLTRGVGRAHRNTIATLIRYYLGSNTHSLRYAFINKLLKEGVDAATIAKIVGHSRLDTLLSYVQLRRAREILNKMVRGVSSRSPA